MRRFDKTKNIEKVNILAEQRFLESKGIIKEDTKETINEEMYDLIRDIKAAFGGKVPRQSEVENYLGRELSDYEASEMYGSCFGGSCFDKPKYQKPTYEVDLTSQSSNYSVLSIKAKTPKAVLVTMKDNTTNDEKEFWVPKSQLKNNVIPAWIIKKNF